MARLKIVLVATFAVLGLFAGSAQAFGPMMMGGHQHGDKTGHQDSTAGHADATQSPVGWKHSEPADDGRFPSNPPIAPQHADSRETHRSDAEHGR